MTSLAVNKKENIHYLNSEWILWAHLPHNTDWSLKSYIKVSSIDTVEHMIRLLNNIPDIMVSNCMLFLMRKGINPTWEDPNNINGGYWSFKVENLDAQNIWFILFKLLIGESLLDNEQNPYLINGISISPKRTFCIVKIWNCKSSVNSVDLLSDVLFKYLDINNVKYISHNTNIERDAEKMLKFKERVDNNEDFKKKKKRNMRYNINSF